MPAEPSAPPNILATAKTGSEKDTGVFAARISDHIRPGDVLLLSGDLGAGKTAFARALIQTLQQRSGPIEEVPSPTYTLLQTYQTELAEIWHVDLYRIGDPSEILELGLLDAGPEVILLVEWPEKASDAWPRDALWLRFEATGPDARTVSLRRFDGDASDHPIVEAFAP